MREIKFRFWDKYEELMVYYTSPFRIKDIMVDSSVGDYQWMQYTGLKDRHGVKIYEGDLLGGTYDGLHVKWCHNQGGYELHYMNECYACNGDIFWHEVAQDNSDVEVIGNIYENPERLNEK